MALPHQDELLNEHLRTHLGVEDASTLALLHRHLQWVEVAAGETLMTQGDVGDSMYISISGRLRAYVRNADDSGERMVREMGRGQIIGEMSLYTQEPRSATVVAIRDSVLVRLPAEAFGELLASSAAVSIALTRQIIQRLQSEQTRSDPARPVTMGLVPVSAAVSLAAFSEGLAEQLRQLLSADRVCLVDAERVDRDLQEPGLARRARDAGRSRAGDTGDAGDDDHRIALYLDRLEACHDYVLLVADAEPTPWTERVGRCSDELLLLADAKQPPVLHATETQFLMQRAGRSEAAEILVLLHPTTQHCPTGTRAWLARRPVTQHLHIRPDLARDMARLARVQARTANGLVLAGGGARGLAHLGVYRALCEQGVEIDFVGGTSIGAVMAALVASDQPVETVIDIARRAFKVNPTGDFNLVPLLSLISGRRLRSVIHRAAHELLGFKADAEDLWKPFYCVASNYSNASEEVLARGGLEHAIMASIAIPGALPPMLHDGQLLCDGGTFNNFPVDVMRRQRGVGRVIGVDLGARKPRRIDLDTVPGGWALLFDRLRPRAKRRYRLPSLMAYLMNVTVLYSTSRQRESQRLCDLYFNPPLDRVGMLQWHRFDQIVEQGRAHGAELLAALPAAALRPSCALTSET